MAKRKEKIIPPINAHWEDVIKASVTNLKLKEDKSDIPSSVIKAKEILQDLKDYAIETVLIDIINPENLLKVGFEERKAPAGRSFHRTIGNRLQNIVFETVKKGMLSTTKVKSNLSFDDIQELREEILKAT